MDADRHYLAPKGFLSRFAESEIDGWAAFNQGVQDFAQSRFGERSESKHFRHLYKGDGKIIMDRIHFDDPSSAMRGVLSAFRVFVEETNRHEFLHVFETAFDLPPAASSGWPEWRERILAAATDTGLAFHPQCTTALPVFWISNEPPSVSALSGFISRLDELSQRFPMIYTPEAGRESVLYHGSGRYAKAGPDPRSPGGWKKHFRVG